MLRLVYSNLVEELMAELSRSVALERASAHAGLFEPVRLILPNRTIETFVSLELARRNGVVAHVETRSLSAWLEDLVQRRLPGRRLLTREALQSLILEVLLDEERCGLPDLAPVYEYIHAAGSDVQAIERRRFQLSLELGSLFDQYTAHRADLIRSWREGLPVEADSGLRPVEAWQRALWREMFEGAGDPGRGPSLAWLSLAELAERAAQVELSDEPMVHVFGYSYLAPVHIQLLERIRDRADVVVYMLNPTREYWSDLRGKRRARALESGPVGEPPLLRLWGRPGRESIDRLNEVVDYGFEERFGEAPTPATTLLGRLQRDVLELRSTAEPLGRDGSVEILACPSLRREVEIVASKIWSAIEDSRRVGRPLRFNQISVRVAGAEPAAYLTHIAAVFREAFEIPHNVIDLSLATESRFVEAVQLLIDLPTSGFDREEVLRFATHPSVLARRPDADVEEWLRWVDGLGIVHGIDRDDLAGTYVEADRLNWEQGLRRLALGVFMEGPREHESRAFVYDDEPYLPEEVSQSSSGNAASFAELVRDLIRLARAARGAPRPASEWFAIVSEAIHRNLRPDGEDDERAHRRVVRALHDLESTLSSDRPVPYAAVRELIHHRIGTLPASRGQHLADGVVVAALGSMRNVPFEVSFVLGLGEGRFPSSSRRSHLDLRNLSPRPGDTTPRDRDEYAFLEAVLGSRSKLCLSYVARDELTGEELQPSSVIIEIQRAAAQYLHVEEQRRLIEVHPLRRYDHRYFPSEDAHRATLFCALPAAGREAHAKALGDDLRGVLGRDTTLPRRELEQSFPTEVWQQLGPLLGTVSLPPPSETARERVRELSLFQIQRFIECPLQGSASVLLGLSTPADSVGGVDAHELFESRLGARLEILRATVLEGIGLGCSDEDELGALFDQRADVLELRGAAPTGFFGRVERERERGVLRGFMRALARTLPGPSRPRVLRLGRVAEPTEGGWVAPPIVIEVEPFVRGARGPQRVEIFGTTRPICVDTPGSIHLLYRARLERAELSRLDRQRLAVGAFVDQLALAAAGVRLEGDRYRSVVVLADGRGHWQSLSASFPVLSPEVAQQRLRRLVSEILSGVHTYLLPFEAVLAFRESRYPTTIEAQVRRLLDGHREFSSRRGPVPAGDLENYPTLEESQAKEYAQQRYGDLFDALTLEGGRAG